MGDAKESIMNSLKELIEKSSYASITVSDICENAHVSRKSFYNIFANKEDVVSAIFKQDVTEPIEKLNVLLTPVQKSGMHLVFYEKIYEVIYKSPLFYRRLIGPMRGKDDTFIRVATNAIYDINIGILNSEAWAGNPLKTDYVAYFFASSQAMLIQKWVDDGMPYTPHDLALLYDEMTSRFWISTFGDLA